MIVKPGLRRKIGSTAQKSLQFIVNNKTSSAVNRGLGTNTYSTGGKRYVPDFEGVLKTVESGSPAFSGLRAVTNYKINSTNFISWVKGGTAGVTGQVVSLPAVNDYISFIGGTVPVKANMVSVYSIQLSGTGTLTLGTFDGVAQVLKQVTLSATPQIFSVKQNSGASPTGFAIYIYQISGDTATSVTADWSQVEDVTGQSIQVFGGYVPTTTAPVTKWFTTLNGNTVDGNGIVTDSGVRTPITPVLGSEIQPNGTFDDASGWTYNTGWSYDVANKRAVGTAVPYTVLISTSTSVTAGKVYAISYTVNLTGGSVLPFVGTGSGVYSLSSGTYTQYVIAAVTGNALCSFYGNNFTGSIDNVSVKEVTGNIGYALYYKGGVLSEPVGTNLINNSAAPATQSIAVTAQPYTLSTYGIGTVTLSGAATGSVTGTATTDIKTLTFTPSAGTLTLTLSGGTVTVMQVETGSVNTSFMIGTGSTTGRAATSDAYQTSGNISDTVGSMYVEFTPSALTSLSRIISGTSGNIAPMFISAASKLSFYDGTNTVASTNSINNAALNKAVVTWTGSSVNIYLNGTQTSGTFDGSLGMGATMGVGYDVALAQPTFNGYIGKINVYSTVLSPTDATRMTQ